LDYIPNRSQIKFLTSRTSESGIRLRGALRDFKRERSKSEFRTVSSSAGIHDRYIVTADQLLLLGHGLKDIGGKESFIIRLEKKLIPDLISEIISAFEVKWKMGTQI